MSDYTEIALDVCTPEGKTWLARITGRNHLAPGGLGREFCNRATENLSRSRRTGTLTFEVPSGVYESNEGRRRLGRRFWIVEDGKAREVSREEALAYLEDSPA